LSVKTNTFGQQGSVVNAGLAAGWDALLQAADMLLQGIQLSNSRLLLSQAVFGVFG